MKFIVALSFLIAVAVAAPANPEADAQIVSQQADIAADLSQYSNSVQTSNGIAAQESGNLVAPKSADESASYAVQGSYSYTAPDGQVITVRYIADALGYRAEGAHLPVAPVA